jgi:hypothetical protein
MQTVLTSRLRLQLPALPLPRLCPATCCRHCLLPLDLLDLIEVPGCASSLLLSVLWPGESLDKSKEAGREQASEKRASLSRLSSHHMPCSDWPRAWELNSLDSLDKAPQTQISSPHLFPVHILNWLSNRPGLQIQ